jgi:pimeloyl-ACP methyl ester carboxylesterase
LRDAYDLHLSNDAVVEFMGGTPTQRPVEYAAACPSQHSLTASCVVIHGTNDDVVPISVSMNYSRMRTGDPVHMIELADIGHMELIDPEEKAFETVAAAINDLLR